MLKRIPKSDISIRPFNSYKEWYFQSGSTTEVSLLDAVYSDYTNIDTTDGNGISFNKHSLYGQLRAQFYNSETDNPLKRTGRKTNVYTDNDLEKERFLDTSAKVFSIPQKYVGDGIKPGSVRINIYSDVQIEPGLFEEKLITLYDDGYSNLVTSNSDVINVSLLDFESGQFNFTNYRTGTPYSTSVDSNTWNLDNGEIRVTYNGTDYDTIIYSWDANASPSLMYVRNLAFLDSPDNFLYMGNVFYGQGIITITRNVQALNPNSGYWDLTYKSTQTNFEHEFLLVVNEDEFNVSTNPTAIVANEDLYEDFVMSDGKKVKVNTKPGPRYIRKRHVLDNGDVMDYRYTSSISPSVKAGFEHWEVSGSTDKTGSFLSPFITTIGLYDDDCNLLAVAKLAKPVKSLPEIPINFIVRFDT
jgi:hypothetical protein